jgi:hypothetical protein
MEAAKAAAAAAKKALEAKKAAGIDNNLKKAPYPAHASPLAKHAHDCDGALCR